MATHKINSETPVEYGVTPGSGDDIIARALELLQARCSTGQQMSNPQDVKNYLILSEAADGREHFRVMWLDARHRIIETQTLSSGTLTQAYVYPREVVRAGLALNAAACIISHNHPSGETEPSPADRNLTKHLKEALALLDIRLLDHVITGGGKALSMAEQGMLL